MVGYGAGTCLCGILDTFWDRHKLVPRHNGFHGPAFPATRDKMQGNLLPPKIFNVLVDNFIRTWLVMIVEDQRVDHDGLGETVGRCMGVFYSYDGMAGSHYTDWLQHLMNVQVSVFQQYGLAASVAKSRMMTFQPGALWLWMSE